MDCLTFIKRENLKVKKTVIYYQLKHGETAEQGIKYIESVIESLGNQNFIKGVFIDDFESQNELLELLQEQLSEIDILFLDSEPKDEFAWQLLNQLSRTENFHISYFNTHKRKHLNQ